MDIELTINVNCLKDESSDPLFTLVQRCEVALQGIKNYKGCSSIIAQCYVNKADENLLRSGFATVLSNATDIVLYHALCLDVCKYI